MLHITLIYEIFCQYVIQVLNIQDTMQDTISYSIHKTNDNMTHSWSLNISEINQAMK